MLQIKKLPEADFMRLAQLVENAYPAFSQNSKEGTEKLAQRLLRVQQEDAAVTLYGGYTEERLTCSMRLHDYTMNFQGKPVEVGGVGLVAVDLLHKKEKQAKTMIEFYLEHYRKRGVNMLMLYPFRPDFYKKMGFGFGPKMEQYRIKPAMFPNYHTKEHLVFLSEHDKELIRSCYEGYTERTHGMLHKTDFELEALVTNPKLKLIGYKKDGRLEGYAAFSFERGHEDNFIVNDIVVKEFVYLHKEALQELSTFFYTQADQIRRIIFTTQDEFFHYLFADARNTTETMIPPVYHETNTAGVGLMYRVINVEKLFQQLDHLNFDNASFKVKFSITDSFFAHNNRPVFIDFTRGKAKVSKEEQFDVEVKLDVSDFSSCIVGAVPFQKLVQYGLAEVSDDSYVSKLHAIFSTVTKPQCMSAF